MFASLVSTGDARAHADALPLALDVVLHPETPSALSIEATFGLLLSDDAESWRWVCHETIARPEGFLVPDYVRNEEGVFLAALRVLEQGTVEGESLYRSSDACDWVPAEGTTGQVVTAVAFAPDDGAVAIAVTGTVDAPNAILRSEDAGATFGPTSGADQAERIFRSVAIGGAAWVTASWFETPGAWVHRSVDGGRSWVEHEIEYLVDDEVQTLVDVVAAHPTDPVVAWLRVDAPEVDVLLRTDDGAVSWVEEFVVEGSITDVILEADGTLWVATAEAGLFRASDAGGFVEVPDVPLVNGLATDARGVHLAVNSPFDAGQVLTSTDAARFEPTAFWADVVGPLECPPDSDVRVLCESIWPMVEAALAGSVAPGGDDDSAGEEPPGCCSDGASFAAGPASVWGLVALGLLRRRTQPYLKNRNSSEPQVVADDSDCL
jgi:hypothetical protein